MVFEKKRLHQGTKEHNSVIIRIGHRCVTCRSTLDGASLPDVTIFSGGNFDQTKLDHWFDQPIGPEIRKSTYF